jgi:hypothetical protein
MHQDKVLHRVAAGRSEVVDFSGSWVNELGSVVEFTQNGNVLAGTYTSAVSEGASSTTGEVQGYVNGNLISFVVFWNEFQAITAWVGQLDSLNSASAINTLWQMTNQTEPGSEWASINAGADTFTPLTAS